MIPLRPATCLFLVLLSCFSASGLSQESAFKFAVSGDSRNCGDVVMPAIAAGAIRDDAAFYWHLGDLRLIHAPDEDYLHEPQHRGQATNMTEYLNSAWEDFIHNQLSFFHQTPVFVGIGNHEVIPPKTRAQFLSEFENWLDSPTLKKQREADQSPDSGPKTYYHWIQGGIDFVYLDNASPDQFDPVQLAWFESVLQRAGTNPQVRSIVVGMHEALPDSLASGHSMNASHIGQESGRRVYTDILQFHEETKKHVYLLASHSHFYMSGIFDSDYWRAHGGVLPGWIIGTGGAHRYLLPADADRATDARQKVYGYLIGTVGADGAIEFQFHEVKRQDVPIDVSKRYTQKFVDYCFDQNADVQQPGP